MVDRELGPDPLKHLRSLLYSPNQDCYGLALSILERDNNPAETHQTFEEIACVDPAVVVLPADLLTRFGRAFLQVHVVRRDRHVIEKSLEPGNNDREQTDDTDQKITRCVDAQRKMPEESEKVHDPAQQVKP